MSQDGDGKQLMMTGMRVAVLGYGSDAKIVATGLRRAGNEVVVGTGPSGMTWVRARGDGFLSMPAPFAVENASVVALHLSDEDQCAAHFNVIVPHVPAAVLLVHGRALALALGLLDATHRDVVVVAGNASACRVAVHADASGRALERAVAFARAAHGPYAQVGTTTILAEAEREIQAMEQEAGGRRALAQEVERAISRARDSHAPDEARLAFWEGFQELLVRRERTTESSVRMIETAERVAARTGKRGVA